MLIQVKNNMIHYETKTGKLTIIQPYNEILYSECIVLLKAYNYYIKNIVKALDNKDIEIEKLRSDNK